jgi:hypothetical protein
MFSKWYQKTNKTEDTNTNARRQSKNVWQLFCDRFLKRPLLTVSRSFMNVANRVLWRMAIILKPNKFNLFESSVLFVFWYHSPNVLDTPYICNISWLRVKGPLSMRRINRTSNTRMWKQHSVNLHVALCLVCGWRRNWYATVNRETFVRWVWHLVGTPITSTFRTNVLPVSPGWGSHVHLDADITCTARRQPYWRNMFNFLSQKQ